MSEYFCHAVHGNDCASLIQASPRISARTRRVAHEYGDLMRMGSIIRAGATLVTPALTAFREGNLPDDPRVADRRLAVSLSLLAHRVLDGYFKPVYRELAPEYYSNEYALSPSDIRIMQDIALYHERRHMKLAEGDPIYDPAVFDHLLPFAAGQEPADTRFLETMFAARELQELLGLHRLFPDGAPTDRKLKSYIMAVDPVYIDTTRYADMVAQPYLGLVQRYIVDPNFYDPGDPLVAMAVDIQNGEEPDPGRLAEARANSEEDLCQWGITLKRAVAAYETAQAYMDGDIDRDEFRERALS